MSSCSAAWRSPSRAPKARLGRSSSASPATSRNPASTRSRSGRRCGSCSTWQAAFPAAGASRPCWPWRRGRGFVRPDELDLPLTFEDARAASTTLGSGVVMAFDETVDLPRVLRRIAAFFRDESCGQCVPCRVGTVRQQEALARLSSGQTRGGGGRRARADCRDGSVHARCVDLRPRADRVERDRVGDRPSCGLQREREVR